MGFSPPPSPPPPPPTDTHINKPFAPRSLFSRTHGEPRMNQAEVIHAGWVNGDRMGVTLLCSCQFDIRDGVLLESEFDSLEYGSYKGGCGPIQKKRSTSKERREMEASNQIDLDLIDFTFKCHADVDNSCTPPKVKFRSSNSLLVKRKEKAVQEKEKMIIRKFKRVSET